MHLFPASVVLSGRERWSLSDDGRYLLINLRRKHMVITEYKVYGLGVAVFSNTGLVSL